MNECVYKRIQRRKVGMDCFSLQLKLILCIHYCNWKVYKPSTHKKQLSSQVKNWNQWSFNNFWALYILYMYIMFLRTNHRLLPLPKSNFKQNILYTDTGNFLFKTCLLSNVSNNWIAYSPEIKHATAKIENPSFSAPVIKTLTLSNWTSHHHIWNKHLSTESFMSKC